MAILSLVVHRESLTLEWPDGHRSEYLGLWLHDSRPEHRDPRNGQRLVDAADLPDKLHIRAAEVAGDVLRVTFEEVGEASLPLEWLRTHCPCGDHHRREGPELWRAGNPDLANRFPFDRVRDSDAFRLQWLHALSRRGLAMLSGVPTEYRAVLEVARLIGWVRETNYGVVFDVRDEPNPNNLAFTNVALGLHTDNPYRDTVPGLQLLHCIQASSDGGESTFADGFAIAAALRDSDPEAFHTLSVTPVRFAFADAVAALTAVRPIIKVDPAGAVTALHYNNRSLAPLDLPATKAAEFYRASKAFAMLLRDPQFVFATPLSSGDLVAFDNQRILHGRSAYPSGSARHLQGCYLDRDGLSSNITVLERRLP